MGKFLDKVVEAVKSTPNDMMLGEKIRQMYHEQVSHEMVITEMSEDEKKHLITWKGDEWTNPDGTPTQAYLDYWTCELCGKHTHEVDYDYLGSGTNHLKCELEHENAYNDYLDNTKSEQLEIQFPEDNDETS